MKKDKVFHFGAGAILQLVLTFIIGPDLAMFVAAGIAWAKEEEYDANHLDAHTVDGWDAFATLVGAVVCRAAINFLA